MSLPEVKTVPPISSSQRGASVNKRAVKLDADIELGTKAKRSDRKLVRETERVKSALEKVAFLVINDPVYVPIMERLEHELAQMQERVENNPLERALALVHQNANF
ncbi:hypothetical protein [Pseudopelagicola sp. nBUS_19]